MWKAVTGSKIEIYGKCQKRIIAEEPPKGTTVSYDEKKANLSKSAYIGDLKCYAYDVYGRLIGQADADRPPLGKLEDWIHCYATNPETEENLPCNKKNEYKYIEYKNGVPQYTMLSYKNGKRNVRYTNKKVKYRYFVLPIVIWGDDSYAPELIYFKFV